MPIKRGKDSIGPYYQWGNAKKYYYIPNNRVSRENAYDKARRQAVAIYSSGYKKS